MTTLDSAATAAAAVAVRKAACIAAQCSPQRHLLLPMWRPATPPDAAHTAALNTTHHPSTQMGQTMFDFAGILHLTDGCLLPSTTLERAMPQLLAPPLQPACPGRSPYRPCCGSHCHC
jgi:hypothetical protein